MDLRNIVGHLFVFIIHGVNRGKTLIMMKHRKIIIVLIFPVNVHHLVQSTHTQLNKIILIY